MLHYNNLGDNMLKVRLFLLLGIWVCMVSMLTACQILAGYPTLTPIATQTIKPSMTQAPTTSLVVSSSSPTLPEPVSKPATLPTNLEPLSLQEIMIKIYEEANQGIVAIRAMNYNGGSLGSGIVLDKEGHIVTNFHVVQDQTEFEVGFLSGFKIRGKVVGADPDSDLAVIKVDAPSEELQPLPLGDSDQVAIGQFVVAIGNPFGLEGTMTIGIVSGLGRTQSAQDTGFGGSSYTIGDIIQTDAAINPGNSGGPLLNLNGEVIGVNESILTSAVDRSNSGVGFAISVNMLKRVVPELIDHGKFVYPYLGIFSIGELSLLEQEALRLPRSTGVYITQVAQGGPADRAGIRAGTVDGLPVLDFNDLIVYIVKNKNPGDTVVMTVLRGNEYLELELTLDARPE